MANTISPGVYTNIIDLSTYVQEVPSTVGLICAITPKGKDNQLTAVTTQGDFISEWGNPDMTKFGSLDKTIGQAQYMAYNFLGESSALYFMRCMPDDAKFAALLISGELQPTDGTTSILISYPPERGSLFALQSSLEPLNHVHPLCVLYSSGRGEYYNALGVQLIAHANPMIDDVYILNVYEKQSDGTEAIVESFEISFNPESVDTNGDSLWIVDILERYSKYLRATMTMPSGDYADGYDLLSRVFDKNIGIVSVTNIPTLMGGEASITDNKQNFHDWTNETEAGNATFMVIAKDSFGNEIYGWIGAAEDDTFGNTAHIFDGRDLTYASRAWLGETTAFKANTQITYRIKESNTALSDAWIGDPIAPVKGGSDGAIKDSMGAYDPVATTEVLTRAFSGTLTNPITGDNADDVLDTENFPFNVIFDGGFVSDVKTQIINLAAIRNDCIAILDNGDNSTVNNSILSRSTNAYNTYWAAIYESYNKIYDSFTGKDIWVSPVYHLSYLIPRNDKVGQLWYAVAGYDRGSIGSIKALRFSPNQVARDSLYLNQINPIVKFSDGYVLFSQLTTQTKASAMQDVNVVRLVLYIKKALEKYCRTFIMDQNDAITWNTITSQITAFLENIASQRGLDSYSVSVGATDYELKRKQCHVNVILTPTKALEQITLNLMIE